ncbi:MAG TPA: CDP-alcohol phosphatidyltransferase family protein [Nitrospiraceae bacterium]|nr:CDP-alcohol phosphatidyltransferase family protein [Nitrospiraceae bacterium]
MKLSAQRDPRPSEPVAAGPVMNVPNTLTTLRILLIPVFIGFLVYERYEYALAALLLAGITDGLDGTIARVANQRTKLGAYLDPLADKLLLTSGFITLSVLHLIPLWIAILVVSRDLILMTGALLVSLTESSLDISPTLLGKGTTLFQLFYMILVVVLTSRHMDLRLIQPLLYFMVGLTVMSGFQYLYRGFSRLNAGEA